MEGGPYQEYFCIEIPVSAGGVQTEEEGEGGAKGTTAATRDCMPRHRRFVYVQEDDARKFPMQFGLEVYIALNLFSMFT